MADPIKFMGRCDCICKPVYEETEVTYEELLEMFPDKCNFVNPLVTRCLELEARLDSLLGNKRGQFEVDYLKAEGASNGSDEDS